MSAQLVLPAVLPDATQGSYYYETITISSGSSPYHSVLTGGSSLPQGLQFSDTEYGPRISGIPEVFGQFVFTVEVSDASTPPIKQARQYHLTIHDAAPHPLMFLADTLPDAVYGAPYGPQILVTGGTYPYTGSYDAGGFYFDRNSSLICGQVLASPGTYHILVTITDSSVPNQRVSQTLTITVRPGISLDSTLVAGTVFRSYSDRIFVTGGGTAPYHFSVASGALPPGVLLDATGALSGTPSIPGTYHFQITVADSSGLTGSQDYSLEIYGLTLAMTPGSLPTGRIGVAYPSTTFAASGGVAPYIITRTGGGTPAGMTLTSDSVLSGTPTIGGHFSFDFTVTDAIGDRGFFVIFLAIQDIVPATVRDADVGSQYIVQVAPDGYTTACNLTLISGALPPGIAFVAIPASSIYEPNRYYLMGTPTQAGAFTFTLEAQDPGGLPADRSYTLRVSLPRLSVVMAHSGHFSPGQVGATYVVTVANAGGGATTDAVTMTESVPAGLTLASMSGAGWNCYGVSCTRSDPLNAFTAYPPIIVAVNVAADAPSEVVNAVSVSGGGSPPAGTTDSVTIAPPLLSISKAHTGDFVPGQTNATYTAGVSNYGLAGPTSGTVTVSETLPSGLVLVSMAGSGWTCPANGNTCARSDVLASGESYPPITITVNVRANAISPQVNAIAVSGGGAATATTTNVTVIASLSKATLSTPSPNTTISGSVVTFLWNAGTGATAYWLDVGTVQGQGNIFAGQLATSVLSQSVSGIPISGGSVYVRLWTQLGGVWQFNDYTYAASNSGGSKAVLISPAPNTAFSGSAVTFTWSAGAGATAYWLDVGTVQGQGNVFAGQLATSVLSQSLSGIPISGGSVYVRLWTQLAGVWQFNDYTYAASNSGGSKAVLISPAPNTTFSGSAVTFTWSAGAGATAYWLDVGTVQGQGNIFAGQLATSVLSRSVSGIPTSGGSVHVRLWTQLGGVWQLNDYTYAASNSGGSKATLISPAPGSTLPGSEVTFTWSAGTGATAYWLDVGTVQGQGNTFAGQLATSVLSQSVSGIPTSGGSVYVRLWTQLAGVWQFSDYTYTASSSGGGKAAMISPAPGSTLPGSEVTFTWGAAAGATAYWIDVGTAQGQGNLFAAQLAPAVLSQMVSGIPTNGATIFVRLWTQPASGWQYSDYTYNAH